MKFVRLSLLVVTCAVLFHSCVKQTFDSPPDTTQYDPKLPVQASLKTFATMGIALGSGNSRQIGDTTVYGVVVADDKSGNYYKQIVIEDTSLGGLVLYLDKSYIYGDYPAGRGLYIKLKGLYLANFKGLPQIVYSVDAAGLTTAIPSGLVNNYIVKGKFPDNSVTAQEVSLEDVKQNVSKYLNTLVKIKDVQFDQFSSGVTYAQPSSLSSGTDRTLEVCDHTASIVLRTSGYSSLQPYATPTGFGSIACIVSTYASAAQLILRDTTDVKMTAPRCQ
ncbi:MAG: hypothetical protein H7257_14385 [Taibaiella sp.]|nr:hypothetical protein [Taibaiella sp.]